MKRRITIDFETRSACDLKKSGAYKYSRHKTTRATCLAVKEHGRQVMLLKFADMQKQWADLPLAFRVQWKRWIDEGYEFSAHNAFFETCIYKNILVRRYGWPDIPFRQFRCTAAKAAACALPRSLEGAGESMSLRTQKDKAGYVAMMATCKPTKYYNAWVKACAEVKAGKRVGPKKQALSKQPAPPMFLEPQAAPDVWETLYRYCKIDAIAEEQLDDSLPDLIPTEQEIWFLNQRLNWRGLKVDIPTIEKVVRIMAVESMVRLKELDALTMGLVTKPGARQSILDFLALEDIVLPDIRAKTVEDVLKEGKLSPDMKRLLEIRQALSKTSTKKFQAFLDRAMPDGRCRDILLYHGAVPTGRDTGTGIQPHNFPRGVVKVTKERPYALVENVAKFDTDTLKMLYGDSLALVFSSILRNMIVPSDGCELYVADFSKIEVAVLWWLAGNLPGLKILSSGKDPYIYQAAENIGKSYEEIEAAVNNEEKWALDARQLGKAQILGCGFRMGWKKFKSTAFDQYRLTLTNKQSLAAVKSYRGSNEAVPDLWDAYEDAVITAVEQPGRKIKAGRCTFFSSHGFLWIQLPSGRRLAYRKPEIHWRTMTFEQLEEDDSGNEIVVERTSGPKKTFAYWGLDKSKKKLAIEFTHSGLITENIVQAVARDLMMPAMLRLEKAGYTPLLMVHDEGLTEKKKGQGSVKEFVKIMCEKPLWADESLPLDAKGWAGYRYRK